MAVSWSSWCPTAAGRSVVLGAVLADGRHLAVFAENPGDGAAREADADVLRLVHLERDLVFLHARDDTEDPARRDHLVVLLELLEHLLTVGLLLLLRAEEEE